MDIYHFYQHNEMEKWEICKNFWENSDAEIPFFLKYLR